MPEMPFQVRWPDGTRETCYSPSTIIEDHIAAGSTYTVAEFVAACGRGLRAASERVRDVYGHSCTTAMGQFSAIEKKAARYGSDEIVHVEQMGAAWRKRA